MHSDRHSWFSVSLVKSHLLLAGGCELLDLIEQLALCVYLFFGTSRFHLFHCVLGRYRCSYEIPMEAPYLWYQSEVFTLCCFFRHTYGLKFFFSLSWTSGRVPGCFRGGSITGHSFVVFVSIFVSSEDGPEAVYGLGTVENGC